jgi:eukaryotic-like serine/threonine-protein kinase
VPGRETVGALETVADAPPWEQRERPTWGLGEGAEIAPGRTVLRQLGGGSRFEVFLVWDEHRLAVLVAKVLRPELASDRAAVRELAREAQLLARLGHPVVVRGFAFQTDGRFPHMLIEHLEGPTLHELLRLHGPVALEQLLPLGMHVASALHYLAAERLLHLDVKPDNVVMGAPPRLIDFSVARTFEQAERTTSPVGTDAYMAPEQCAPGAGEPIGPPADVFGLGATLFHALTGERPFPRDGEERHPQLTRDPPRPPKRTPREIAALLSAMLARRPADRPTAREVVSALEPVVSELTARRAARR